MFGFTTARQQKRPAISPAVCCSQEKQKESVAACSGVQVATDSSMRSVGDQARGFMAPDTSLTISPFSALRRHSYVHLRTLPEMDILMTMSR